MEIIDLDGSSESPSILLSLSSIVSYEPTNRESKSTAVLSAITGAATAGAAAVRLFTPRFHLQILMTLD